MEDIVSRFMKIKKPEQAWKPDYHKEQMSAESISARRTTSSVIEQPHIVGRDEELAKVKQFLLSSDARGSDDVDDHVSVMAIVGMGGLGKTTLAQLAYNDDQVNQHFQLKSWVCVSEDFDVIRLTKAMLQSLNVEASSLSELDPLQKNLLQKLEGQGRLLLVLDDVWEADNLNAHGWNLLTAPLRNRSAGTNIIMTTRSRKVPEMAPRTSTYDLGFLMAGGKSCLIQSDIRHLSINPTSDSRGTIIPSIKDIPEPNFFRSYVLPGINRYVSIFERVRRSDSYTRMEHLRVLDLGGAGPRRLPKSIARLKHLRYLRISNLVEELPEFVGSMHHLQTLDLEGPYQLPNSMSNLHNLRHIKLSSDVIEYPVGIGKLTDLQTLPGFRVSPKHNHAKLGELKDMNNIRGEFSIEGLDNLASVNEAKKACLDKKRNISYLHLEWDHEADSSPIDEEVLESLKPSVKLRSLKISGFKGPSYPSWLGDLSFSRLHTIKLEHCGNWASLPPLGQLPSLKSLYISEAGAVEYIGGEFFSGGFPQLEELTLENMYNWKSWCGAREGDCPKLKKLSISSCENLESLSLINLGGVEVLFISECPELRFLPGDSLELSHLQRVQKITIQGIYQVGCIEAAHFFTAAPLEDQSCLILDSVGQREAEYMLGLRSSICRLTVRWCWNLTSLPLGNLSALEYVEISECPQLRITSVYPQQQQVPSLKKICVHQIHDAEIIAVLFEKSHLELENVDQLVASFLLKELSHMIRRLTVIRCANLTSLPLMELTALKYLEISECNQLQLSSGSLQLPQSSSMLEINIQCIRGAEYVGVRFSPGGTEALETSCLELTKVDKLEALFLLNEFSHMIHRLAITRCVNLTSLPLMELTALRYLKISECNQLQLSSGSLQLPQSSSMLEMKIKYICGVEYIRVLFSPGGTKALETSCLELTNVDKLEALFVLNEFSHMIHRLTISRCANLTSLPWTDLTTLEYLRISECPMFQLLDAQQLPSTLQVLCIYGNSYETEQCSRHQHFQRLKQVRQCSEGGERNLYLVFRNVHDASAASKFCSMGFTKIYTLDIEWDCCTNDCSNVTDSITHEVLLNINSLCFSSKKLVIRGYTGSAFASWYADFFSKKLHTDFLHRLSSVSLLQCSKCEILPPLSRLFFLKELYVEGASSLGSFMQDYDDMSEEGWQETQTRIAFPELRKLEFHDMPMWKEWLGTREGDFPRLRKLILKHCPKLRALPHLPPSLQELELEACHVLTSLSIFDSDHTMSLISAKPFRWLSLSTSKGTSPILQHMSLTNCPLLLAWCEGHPRILADIPNLLIDGVRVHTSSGNSIRSQSSYIAAKGGKLIAPGCQQFYDIKCLVRVKSTCHL
ncbi:hypothetical protein Taro_028554 [Colocasia esculenta]|uniref:NB-ARC domain-containing protein n=1 Tax=Colocasia esculenta TaxID=4460 RepID=A0A843VS74_COLES|nr:hypothetical protein [Colocasia esculenta]